MQIDPESGVSRPMISLSNTLFPVPLRPSTARVSPRFTRKLIPFKTLWPAKDLYTFSTATTGTELALPGFRLLHRNVISCGHICFTRASNNG